VLSINERLLGEPDRMRRDRGDEAWLVDLEPTRLRTDLSALFQGRRARKWWQRELRLLRERLVGFQAAETGTLPDGGDFDPLILDRLEPETRKLLVEEFLLRTDPSGGSERR
jgi:hypothetical protein